MKDDLVLRSYCYHTKKQRNAQTTFATWCISNAASCVLPLGLDADAVAWVTSVMQSGGAMAGIENVTALEKTLKLHRTPFRFHTKREWDSVLLTARVLLRTWEKQTGGSKREYPS
jgi:hypothetical protein